MPDKPRCTFLPTGALKAFSYTDRIAASTVSRDASRSPGTSRADLSTPEKNFMSENPTIVRSHSRTVLIMYVTYNGNRTTSVRFLPVCGSFNDGSSLRCGVNFRPDGCASTWVNASISFLKARFPKGGGEILRKNQYFSLEFPMYSSHLKESNRLQ